MPTRRTYQLPLDYELLAFHSLIEPQVVDVQYFHLHLDLVVLVVVVELHLRQKQFRVVVVLDIEVALRKSML